MYVKRAIEKALKKAQEQSKVVLLTGARQVGKSTTLRELFPSYPYITLDDENALLLAKQDREGFFRDRSFPLIIDEVQYAPELFRTIKKIVDSKDEKGLVFLSGSQTYELMNRSAESLAGRVSIIEMPTMSLRELCGADFDTPFSPTDSYIAKREKKLARYDNLWSRIHRGSMPELLDTERDREWFYRDYVRTYIERDVRSLVNIKNEMKFRAFLVSLAARSGQELVYAALAADVGVDIKTVQSWLSIVQGAGLVRLVHTYGNNTIKRMTKTPKLYFMDTGLLCYLVGWTTAETAKNGAMAGNIFETFVVSEIIKSYMNAGKSPEQIFYYRDRYKREIDLVIEEENVIHPVEIKKAATIDRSWAKNFSVLDDIPGKKRGAGCVICTCDGKYPLDSDNRALSIEYV